MPEHVPLTEGEYRVRINFCPPGNEVVKQIKTLTAQLIDIYDSLKSKDPRAASLAMTEAESAAHWGVKAATA